MQSETDVALYASPREQVTRAITEWIRNGTLTPGAAVPPENVISEQLKVARGTVRSSLEKLEIDGLITKINRRRFVSRRQPAAASSLIADTVLVLGINSDDPMQYKNTGFMDAVQAGSVEELLRSGLHSLNLQTSRLDEPTLNQLLSLSPRGALMFQDLLRSENGKKILRLFQDHRVPVITDYEAPATFDCDRAISDHSTGNYQLTRRLIDCGCTRILSFIPTHRDEFWVRRKREGFLRAMGEAGLEPLSPPENYSGSPVFPDWSEDSYHHYTRLFAGHLIEHFSRPQPPDAIMAATDWDVPLVAAAVRLFGKEPGRDVIITGYDHKTASCQWNRYSEDRPAFTIDKRNTEIGRVMVEILQQRLSGILANQPEVRLVKPELIDFTTSI